MNKPIKKIAVLGSGIMGSSIACHFANIGVEVLLFDIVPHELTSEENLVGLTLDSRKVKNRIVESQFLNATKQKNSPIYSKQFLNRIKCCNLVDDLKLVNTADWVLEVVVENIEIKNQLFDKIESYISEHAIISTNTSGIPIQLIAQGRSEKFQERFCGTHFFNPPRYLQLLEIIPTSQTNPELVEFLLDYGRRFLGKKTIKAKDTPAFIANRIGVYSIMQLFHSVLDSNLTVAEIDVLTGTMIGRPKSATFRTADVVGLDTLIHVANGLNMSELEDECKSTFELPPFLKHMKENQWLGDKSGQGFYKKEISDNGKHFLTLNLNSLAYDVQEKPKIPLYDKIKNLQTWQEKWSTILEDDSKYGTFYKKMLASLFSYSANRIPEIADEIIQIDDALKAGFGWTQGPFEIWNDVGIEKGLALIKTYNFKIPHWVEDMPNKNQGFYYHDDDLKYYSQNKQYSKVQNAPFILSQLPSSKTIWTNKACQLQDIGDGILNLSFSSKMNTIDGDVLTGINKAIDISETSFKGLVISNQSDHFSAGANIGMIFMMAVEQDFDELNMVINYFQKTMMRLRYSSIPVVAAPYNLTLGGGCELCMHVDKVVAHAETYMGLVEVGVGLIPGGGGTKEFTKRASELFHKGDIEVNVLQEYFMTIAQAKVSTSAHEAFEYNYLKAHKDLIIVNKELVLKQAKKEALNMAEIGYSQPISASTIKVLGKQAIGMFNVGVDSMKSGNYISEHDAKIANKIAYVMSGGNLSEPTLVNEQYLLDIEREAFLSLCGERKTLERIQFMLQSSKPLRN